MLNKVAPAPPEIRLPFLDDDAAPPASARGLGAAADKVAFDKGPTASRIGRAERRPQQKRRSLLRWSLMLLVVLPTLVTAFYYLLFAANQFAVEVKFAVRSPSSSSSATGDVLGAVTGMPSLGAGITDSYIVMDYVLSREVVDEMEKRIGFRKIYSRNEADFWMRLNPEKKVEEIVKYWRWMIRVNFDTISQIVSYEVRAFTAVDAKLVAETLLKLSEEQVNELSARARADAVTSSQTEVARMEERVKAVRTSMREFREKYNVIDPVALASGQMSSEGKLEEELIRAKADMEAARQYMAANAPTVDVLANRIRALEKRLAEERAKHGKVVEQIGQASKESLTSIIARYEALLVEREFADKALVSAFGSLERARADADRQQRYTAAFVRPQTPQLAIYPQRVLNTFIVLGISLIMWSLLVLMVYAIRDHAG